MRPSVFVRTQYWYAEGVPAASDFHTGLLQTVWKCGAEKQRGWNCTWPPLSPSLVAPLVKLKRKSSGRPHYLTRPGSLEIPRKQFYSDTACALEEEPASLLGARKSNDRHTLLPALSRPGSRSALAQSTNWDVLKLKDQP